MDVGDTEGTFVGLFVTEVGTALGVPVGTLVGLAVGEADCVAWSMAIRSKRSLCWGVRGRVQGASGHCMKTKKKQWKL